LTQSRGKLTIALSFDEFHGANGHASAAPLRGVGCGALLGDMHAQLLEKTERII